MSTVHSRNFWSCSAAMLTCLSCILMVWHAIMFLLMTGYQGEAGNHEEAFAAKFLLGESAAFVVVNWLIWRDFVNNYKDSPDEPDDLRLLYNIMKLHKRKAIRTFKYSDMADSEVVPTSCVVCLEDFAEADYVAQLPCGHTFHPTCAHKWIMEDWRCPFRCPLDIPKSEQPTEEAEVTHPHEAVDDVATVDVEAGGVRS